MLFWSKYHLFSWIFSNNIRITPKKFTLLEYLGFPMLFESQREIVRLILRNESIRNLNLKWSKRNETKQFRVIYLGSVKFSQLPERLWGHHFYRFRAWNSRYCFRISGQLLDFWYRSGRLFSFWCRRMDRFLRGAMWFELRGDGFRWEEFLCFMWGILGSFSLQLVSS